MTMPSPNDTAPDASSIKPVSSLRSKFETLAKVPPALTTPSGYAREPVSSPGRLSLDMQRPQPPPGKPGSLLTTVTYGTHVRHSSTSSPKSSSMVDLSTPLVTIDSPHSPTTRVSPRLLLGSPRLVTPKKPQVSHFASSYNAHTPAAQPRPAEVTDSRPPPINRAGKPNLLPNPVHPPVSETAKTPPAEPSPFSTPPSSTDGTPIEGNSSHSIFADPLKQTQTSAGYFGARSSGRKHSRASQISIDLGRQGSLSSRIDPAPENFVVDHGLKISHVPPTALASSSVVGRRTSNSTTSRPHSRTQPVSVESSPPLPIRPLARTQGSTSASTILNSVSRRKISPPAVPAPRRSVDVRRSIDTRNQPVSLGLPTTHELPSVRVASVSASPPTKRDLSVASEIAVDQSQYPDTAQMNRRPPRVRTTTAEISTGYDTRLCALSGEYVATTGYVTKIWSTETGQPLASLIHGENVRVTSMCWKPARELIDNDKRMWLGTGDGTLLELDVAAGATVHDRSHVHPRAQVIKIYRHASDMFTLDDDGRLLTWRAKADQHAPSLGDTPTTFRVQRGHTASIAVRNQLWIASGKDVRVHNLNARSEGDWNYTSRPLNQESTAEISSAAILCEKQDQVYFGHIDGKVSIYSRNDFSCVGIVNVSIYKISTLAGVGPYLWAGYTTGMIYVYDTSTTPWRVMKDWKAHSNPVATIVVDQASAWESGEIQVVSLGTDNVLRLWDGALGDDWHLREAQAHDTEYCTFEELSVTVLTWNIGATTPSSLQGNNSDCNFFRDFLTEGPPPSILVFGFQELVDLEDKKLTAKSFFKSKKKDPSQQEHMSRQYRAWRDYLVKCVENYMPADESYHLLHTASMVGLFSCVFVKADLRSRVRHVSTGEVKRGIGGLHGNKGAILLRLVLDDSSLCFVNCHLAAGQSQTTSRHNDVAAVLESEILPAVDSKDMVDTFVGGGDGSMIMDHETCILNGDLNYRIDAMTRDAIVRAVREDNLSKLLDRDQLLLSRKRNPGFRLRAFAESPITFAPTYKYNVGTDEYDTSEKKRSPAWCDRILTRGLRVSCTEYRRWDGVRASDHRPVSGRFSVQVKKVDPTCRNKTVARADEALMRFKSKVAHDVKLDYLVNVYGLAVEEAATYLAANP